jgi:hypothetical protein
MDKYHIRRMILEELVVMAPVPLTYDDVCGLPQLASHHIKPDAVASELQGLAEKGYVADLRPGRGGLYRSTAAGREQVNREAELDEFVWGDLASRFMGGAA